jgi:hypothetical protein
VEEDDSTNQALRLLGQSVGIISLGRRIVLIEGTTSSLDKQTYGFLLKNRYPSLVLVPTGGKDDIRAFGSAFERVLSKTLWGVEFFMICDRDAADASDTTRLEAESNGRLRFLKKYHLENYFLDAPTLATVFEHQLPADSWLRSPDRINEKLRELAKANVSYAAALIASSHIRRQVGSVSVMPKGCHGKSSDDLVALINTKVTEEATRASSVLRSADIEQFVRKTYSELESAANDPLDSWKAIFPGKQVFAQFAAAAGIDGARLKLAFLNQVTQKQLPIFDDVMSIFSDFASRG